MIFLRRVRLFYIPIDLTSRSKSQPPTVSTPDWEKGRHVAAFFNELSSTKLGLLSFLLLI